MVNPVNLDKFHYTVTERTNSGYNITSDVLCESVGFTHSLFYDKVIDDRFVD